ncbi:MAG: OmpA family protein [Candidatus Binatia bacterium]
MLPTGTAGKTAPHDAEVEHLMHEFLSTGESIEEQPGGTEPLQFPGPPNKPNWFQALMVTRDENPLLERQCKKQALEFSIESLRLAKGAKSNAEALRAAAEHMKHHQDFIKNNKISYAKYLQEIAECRTFCGPLVANLIKCHVLSVARHTHGIVLFKLDSDAINPRYQAGAISVVARQLQEHSDSKVLLIGRASKIGELTYNRQLAARRTLAVRDSLLAKGISFERIKVMWFGWEPPQISSFVATEYGLEDLFHEAGLQEINQSVTMVLY